LSSRKVIKPLIPGSLVKFKNNKYNDLLMYFGKSKDKKRWHRKYYFLSKGKVIAYPQEFLTMFEVIIEQ